MKDGKIELEKAKKIHEQIELNLGEQMKEEKPLFNLIPTVDKVVSAMGLRPNDCHRQLPRDNEYRGLGLGGGAICVEESMLLVGLIWAHKPDIVVELGTSQGASSLVLAAACKDIECGHAWTVDLAENPPSMAHEIYERYDLPLTFVNSKHSMKFLEEMEVDRSKRYLFFSDTDIKVRPKEVQTILNKFPSGTLIAVHDTSDLHPLGPMKLPSKVNKPMVEINTPRGITILKV